MIVTFTMNPAIDRTLLIPDFEPGKVNHVGITITDAGGNGVNVCRALKIMGTDSMTCGFIAGKNGRFIKDTLSSLNIPYDFVDVPGETRINIKIVDRNGLHTDINESGFEINETDFNPDTWIYIDQGSQEVHGKRLFIDAMDMMLHINHMYNEKGCHTYPHLTPGGHHCEADWERIVPVFIPYLYPHLFNR